MADSIPAQKQNNAASGLFSLTPVQFTTVAAVLGVLLTDYLDLDQQNAFGNFLMSIGQTILTAASQGQLLKPDDENNDDRYIQAQLSAMQSKIDALEKRLDPAG